MLLLQQIKYFSLHRCYDVLVATCSCYAKTYSTPHARLDSLEVLVKMSTKWRSAIYRGAISFTLQTVK